ncbi:MAG: hypothetical protein V7K94_16010, partial [Nostoc sp.]|uniref:hypothetical protein n=1 Tax=Nostoc sp. TaxID=1180 RepID=UPI002FFC6BB0
ETTVHTVLNLTPMTLIKLLLHTCKFSRRLTYHFFVRLRQILLASFFAFFSTRRYANGPFAVRSLYSLAHLHTELV